MTPDEIKTLRLAYGETREQFARRLNVTASSLWRWESGRFGPDARSLRRLLALKAVKVRMEKKKEAKA